jgi:hypothetical protein
MDADFSIELGRDDPRLDFPWEDPSGELAYRDLKRSPELIAGIKEAQEFPELKDFLQQSNSSRSTVETAKCDAWSTSELSVEEEIYALSHKFASYVDAVFCEVDSRLSLYIHEQWARKLVALLRKTPETASAAAEICVRRCYFGEDSGVGEGFYFTLYVSGYGNDEASARRNWEVGLKVTSHAILQLSEGEG